VLPGAIVAGEAKILQSPGQSLIETISSSYCSKQSRYGNLKLIIRIILDKAKLTGSVEKRSKTKKETYGSNTLQYVPAYFIDIR
jgi:hypothetical protein